MAWEDSPGLAAVPVAAVAVGVAVSGCGSTSAPPHAAALAATTARSDPGAVAVGFTRALFGGEFHRAGRYVATDSRNALQVITMGLRGASVSQRDLVAGSTLVDGGSATTILTGTLCSTHTRSVTPSKRDCITNRDPHSRNPAFRVTMTLGPDPRWRVS